MAQAGFERVELVVRTMAQTAVDNETYFSELDAVVGDGDFGYSLARGFEIVLADWDDLDRTDVATFLRKVAVILTSRIGGTSGPIWGTAFLRAGGAASGADGIGADETVAMLRAGDRGHQAARRVATSATRPCSTRSCPRPTPWRSAWRPATTRGAALARGGRRPRRRRRRPPGRCSPSAGRAAYTGERSIGTLDAGAVGVAVMFERLAEAWPKT